MSRKSYEMQKQKNSIVFFLILFVFIGGYAFFFSSTAWMPSGVSATLLTELGTENSWQDRVFTVTRWDYCESTRTMEVEMNVENEAYDGINAYQYTAADRNGDNLTITGMVEDSDWIILQISGVSSEFGEMSLRINLPDQDVAEALKVYTNIHAVNMVDSIEKKDKAGYFIDKLTAEKAACEAAIEENETQIETLQEQNTEMQAEIDRLTSGMGYQTESEQETTNNKILDIQSRQSTNQDEITKCEEEIEEQKEQIILLESQIAEVEKNGIQ